MFSQATAQRIKQQNNPKKRLDDRWAIAVSFLAMAAGQWDPIWQESHPCH